MKSPPLISNRAKRVFGWIGASCLLLIIPLKTLRWTDQFATLTVVGIAPSILGPAGLLFLILSGSSPRLTHLTILQTTVLAGAIAIGLEFIQLIPRSGILARVHYTFDWLDVAATICSISGGYVFARVLTSSKEFRNN